MPLLSKCGRKRNCADDLCERVFEDDDFPTFDFQLSLRGSTSPEPIDTTAATRIMGGAPFRSEPRYYVPLEEPKPLNLGGFESDSDSSAPSVISVSSSECSSGDDCIPSTCEGVPTGLCNNRNHWKDGLYCNFCIEFTGKGYAVTPGQRTMAPLNPVETTAHAMAFLNEYVVAPTPAPLTEKKVEFDTRHIPKLPMFQPSKTCAFRTNSAWDTKTLGTDYFYGNDFDIPDSHSVSTISRTNEWVMEQSKSDSENVIEVSDNTEIPTTSAPPGFDADSEEDSDPNLLKGGDSEWDMSSVEDPEDIQFRWNQWKKHDSAIKTLGETRAAKAEELRLLRIKKNLEKKEERARQHKEQLKKQTERYQRQVRNAMERITKRGGWRKSMGTITGERDVAIVEAAKLNLGLGVPEVCGFQSSILDDNPKKDEILEGPEQQPTTEDIAFLDDDSSIDEGDVHMLPVMSLPVRKTSSSDKRTDTEGEDEAERLQNAAKRAYGELPNRKRKRKGSKERAEESRIKWLTHIQKFHKRQARRMGLGKVRIVENKDIRPYDFSNWE